MGLVNYAYSELPQRIQNDLIKKYTEDNPQHKFMPNTRIEMILNKRLYDNEGNFLKNMPDNYHFKTANITPFNSIYTIYKKV